MFQGPEADLRHLHDRQQIQRARVNLPLIQNLFGDYGEGGGAQALEFYLALSTDAASGAVSQCAFAY